MWIKSAIALCVFDLLTLNAGAQVLHKDGKDVPLSPSRRFMALQLKPGFVPSTALLAKVVDPAVARGSAPAGVLAAYHVALFEKVSGSRGVTRGRANAGGQSEGDSLKFLAAVRDVGTPLPVFELGGADVVVTGEVLILPRPGMSPRLEQEFGRFGKFTELPHGRFKLTVSNPLQSLEVSNSIARSDVVVAAEPNFITVVRPGPKFDRTSPVSPQAPHASAFPSDVLFSQQWSDRNNGATGKSGADINVMKAWGDSDGSGIVIAVLDDGVDETHPDLRGKAVRSFDAITNKAGQAPGPYDVHGTACAGITAAQTNNIVGIAGVGFAASIMPVRIASTDEQGNWSTTTEIIARGIDYAVDNGADVLSNSWVGGDSSIVEDAIRRGVTAGRQGRGAVFVFAAGNDGGPIAWPAKLAGTLPVLAVGATNEWDERKTTKSADGESWWASNVGPELSVVAPGVHILTTAPKGSYFSKFNGTSSAVPQVAGVAALILSKDKDKKLSAADVKQKLQSTAHPLGSSTEYGAGRIDACRALGLSGC